MSEVGTPVTALESAETVLTDPRQRSKLSVYAATRFGIAAADAEDLLQEAALGMLRQRSAVRNPSGFVFAVFRSKCARFSQARRLRGESMRTQREQDEAIPETCGWEEIERRVALREALNGISASCRRLLSAHYFEGQSLTEAAREMALAYGAVSKRISRCLERLRECLN